MTIDLVYIPIEKYNNMTLEERDKIKFKMISCNQTAYKTFSELTKFESRRIQYINETYTLRFIIWPSEVKVLFLEVRWDHEPLEPLETKCHSFVYHNSEIIHSSCGYMNGYLVGYNPVKSYCKCSIFEDLLQNTQKTITFDEEKQLFDILFPIFSTYYIMMDREHFRVTTIHKTSTDVQYVSAFR